MHIALITSTIVPDMSTMRSQPDIASMLLGQVRSTVLALLFSHAEESYYLRQIIRMTGAAHGAVQRELAHLHAAGLVTRVRRGNQVYYQADRESPVFAEVRGLIVKTAGVASVLRAALASVAGNIEIAFIYGSVAKGTEKSNSDIDVMVIGEVTFGDIVQALLPAQQQLGREVNPSVFTPGEIRDRIANSDHFINTILREDKIILIGDEHDLDRLVELRVVDRASDE